VPIEELALGRERRMCEALLTLHAIADEACASLGVALDDGDSGGAERFHPDELDVGVEQRPRFSVRACCADQLES
jgi:hypothetical protein